MAATGAAAGLLAPISGMRSGSSKVKVLPSPGTLLTVMEPPSNPARSREMDRPRPVPP
jgi:hypothetical protein